MNDKLLKFENVSYARGNKEILNRISWTIKKGEQWVLLGPNGAGKSTLLDLIYGFLWPNVSGTIYRQGKQSINLQELRKSIGLVAGNLRRLIPRNEIVLDTVVSGKYAMFGLRLNREEINNKEYEKAALILDSLGILSLNRRISQTLSHGEFQKVMLARSLMSDPYLILLDEPLDGLDPGAQAIFLDTLSSHMQKNSEPSFIYVTHHINEITPDFKKVFVLKDGESFFQGDISEAMTAEFVSALYDYDFDLKFENYRYQMSKRAK